MLAFIYKLSVFLKLIHATWLVEMYNFLSFVSVKGLLHNLVKEKDHVPGIVYHLKMRNLSDAKYTNLKIAKLTCRKNFM